MRTSLRLISRRQPTIKAPMLVVAPHQDDETLGCGGMIARQRMAGIEVSILFITDGSASHPTHPAVSPEEISALRRREAQLAAALLGVESTSVYFLDVPDGTLADLGPGQRGLVVKSITRHLTRIKPREIFLPCCPDSSSEHDAVFGLVVASISTAGIFPRLWEYPIWAWWNPLILINRIIHGARAYRQPTEDYAELKNRALAEYRSQMHAVPPEHKPALHPRFVRVLNSTDEYFFQRRYCSSHAQVESVV